LGFTQDKIQFHGGAGKAMNFMFPTPSFGLAELSLIALREIFP
jgi:hypothetical protein